MSLDGQLPVAYCTEERLHTVAPTLPHSSLGILVLMLVALLDSEFKTLHATFLANFHGPSLKSLCFFEFMLVVFFLSVHQLMQACQFG